MPPSRPIPIDRLFRALADRTRLRLLNLMRDGEVCVCVFTEVLKMEQPKVSRHLAYLRAAGLVQARRQGRWMHYRIANLAAPAPTSALGGALEAVRHDPLCAADRARMRSICCAPPRLVRLRGVPLPELRRTAAPTLS